MIVVYGATGYTGALVAAQLVASGIRPVLAGRNRDSLLTLARPWGLDIHVGGLTDGLPEGTRVLVNCAGPFDITQPPLLRASMVAGSHYLDLAGEVDEHVAAMRQGAEADERGVLVLPGAGFGIVPSEGLLSAVVARLATATHATVALKTVGPASRGTAEVVLGSLRTPGVHRRDGILRTRRPGAQTTRVDFVDGDGPTVVTTNPWRGDLASAAPTVSNLDASMALPAAVRSLMHVPHGSLLKALARRLPAGPSAARRERGRTAIRVDARDSAGGRASAVLLGPDAYTFTALLAAAAAARVLESDSTDSLPTGYRLPSEVLGADFALSIPGVRRIDIE